MDLKQLSFKTDDPNMVTFHFKKEGAAELSTHTASVTPTQKAQCVAAVKSAPNALLPFMQPHFGHLLHPQVTCSG